MPATRRAIDHVHRAVNRSIVYTPDIVQYGVADRWVAHPPSGRGDCEDYALTKRAMLAHIGSGPDDSRVVLGFDWRGNRHAVLYVRDDRDEWWVLDNQVRGIVRAGRQRFRPDRGGPWGEPDMAARPPRP